ncbi:uncharacterized protein YALI1_B12874g [Yarrowia lipolytica]|uniref:Uncharacterized protein n=1 Tax=Yarrowia lipolytica TaxID=4952 RepID=A0A1D8N753_YARLL|nr:hypothetical protein YALI1_B12874g [Yarrowia lipolytica]
MEPTKHGTDVPRHNQQHCSRQRTLEIAEYRCKKPSLAPLNPAPHLTTMRIAPQTIQIRPVNTRDGAPSTHNGRTRNARVVVVIIDVVLGKILVTLLAVETLHKPRRRRSKPVGSTRLLSCTPLSGISQMLHGHSMGIPIHRLLLEPLVSVGTLGGRRVGRRVGRRSELHIAHGRVSTAHIHVHHLVAKIRV